MRKLYSLMIALLLCSGAYAQIPANQEVHVIDNSLIPQRYPNNAGATRAGTQLWLEYDSADAYNFSQAQVHTIQWVMNKNYGFNPLVNTWQRYVVRFDSLYDINTMSAFRNEDVDDITIDSIYTVIGHQNNSGQNDTIIMRILNVDPTTHYPGNTVLDADTFVTNTSLSPSQNWHNPVVLMWRPNYFSNTIQRFAVELSFYGSLSDTCAFLVGFNNLGASGVQCPYRANIGNFYPNSYAAWTNYVSAYPLLPDAAGNDLIQDCNQNNQFDDGVDGYNFIQDIVVGSYITVNSAIAVHEVKGSNIGMLQNVPNPFSGMTTVKYEITNNAKEVSLHVYDVVGREVYSVNEGSKTAGKYNVALDAAQFAKGIYTYTLRGDGNQATRKMIVE